MTTTTLRSDDAVILRLRGRLTADGDAPLAAAVGRLADTSVQMLVLDFRDVSYVDSTCLGELIAAYKALRARGAKLRLVNLPPRVRRLLDLSGLTDVLGVRVGVAAMAAAASEPSWRTA